MIPRPGSIVAIGLCLVPTLASAQPTPATPTPAPTEDAAPPAAPPAAPAATVDVSDRVDDLTDEVEDLRSEVKDLSERLVAARAPVSPSALNPAMTAFLNGLARVDDHDVFAGGSSPGIDNRILLRSLEVELRAAVDPFADAVAIFGLGYDGAGFAAEVDEAYVVLKRLPVINAAPLGLKLKLGRFRAPFGMLNRVHLHDLPWSTRPLPIAHMFGESSTELDDPSLEGGFSPVGADAELLLPELIPGVVMEVNADVLDTNELGIAGHDSLDASRNHLGFLGRFNLFFTAHDTHDVNLGASALVVGGPRPFQMYGADVMYKWKPLAAGEFHSVVLGGELLWADRREAANVHTTRAFAAPLGYYAFAQLQLDWHTYLGARYDHADDLFDNRLHDWNASAYLTYYTSEFLRFRIGYEHGRTEFGPPDNSGFAEVNVVFGSHPTEPYWVNR